MLLRNIVRRESVFPVMLHSFICVHCQYLTLNKLTYPVSYITDFCLFRLVQGSVTFIFVIINHCAYILLWVVFVLQIILYVNCISRTLLYMCIEYCG